MASAVRDPARNVPIATVGGVAHRRASSTSPVHRAERHHARRWRWRSRPRAVRRRGGLPRRHRRRAGRAMRAGSRRQSARSTAGCWSGRDRPAPGTHAGLFPRGSREFGRDVPRRALLLSRGPQPAHAPPPIPSIGKPVRDDHQRLDPVLPVRLPRHLRRAGKIGTFTVTARWRWRCSCSPPAWRCERAQAARDQVLAVHPVGDAMGAAGQDGSGDLGSLLTLRPRYRCIGSRGLFGPYVGSPSSNASTLKRVAKRFCKLGWLTV